MFRLFCILKNKSSRSLYQPNLRCSDRVLVIKTRKVCPLLREKRSSCYWNCKCKTCVNIRETNTFQSFATKKFHKINHYYHCDSKSIVYLISRKMSGLQYFGLIIDRFYLKWNDYKCFHTVTLADDTPK